MDTSSKSLVVHGRKRKVPAGEGIFRSQLEFKYEEPEAEDGL